ncbi:potassium channel family protein [Helicobacter heilmannii]|uniref:Trk system potassium uptake protein TrkA n=1 Tax=Helicobacter heilmannii TaxID=35817 RepID=A0A0K2XI98_HELHE|nr:TrkA family potassium uptake protein [Helicobacter heilmannii]CCM11760.1 TrkA [Helicobacter heilmannii ASB1.4]CRF45318.1 Trk system potassium uptake protein TrkA [Helicobacter heilmannii]CRF46775.1 Trk system potassium uptake protein TrkA [Helicobacter heilmannii]CRF49370.1 Trk system potassium uptake protein TrkA [Helicobacter heilmannii]CRF51574.1 Trk system potassium uptake protein TrkA [Helicobacter heilmannii]
MKMYAVLGLGKFGAHVARGLIDNGEQIIAVDVNEERVKLFKSLCDNLFILDTTDSIALKETGISEVDIAIVSIGQSVEASILTVMALKESGVKEVIAKASTLIHGKILSKIGTDRVIYPERDAAKRLVRGLSLNTHLDIIEITTHMRLVRFLITSEHAQRSLQDFLDIFKADLKVVALKHGAQWDYQISMGTLLVEGDILLLMGMAKEVDIFLANKPKG